jgi:hypothetical protein
VLTGVPFVNFYIVIIFLLIVTGNLLFSFQQINKVRTENADVIENTRNKKE